MGANLRAWLQTGRVLIELRLSGILVYRFNLLITFAKTILLVQIFRELWLAIYGVGNVEIAISAQQAITYSALSMLLLPLFSNDLIWETEWKIHSGDVLFDLIRPTYYGDQLFFSALGRTLGTFLVTTVPTLVVVALTLRLTVPTTARAWGAVALSLMMGLLINFLLDYVCVLLGFWTTRAGGMANFKSVLSQILGGWYVPLWVFPPLASRILLFLPFAGISYTPLSIFVGAIGPQQVPLALTLQAAWILMLLGATRLLYRAVVRKLSIQGG